MSTKDLIDAIFAGDTLAIEKNFNDRMDAVVGEKLGQFKEEVSSDMFKEEVEIEGLEAIIEAYEELDELSKTTLSNYVKKASTDVANKAVDAADPHGKSQRERGLAYQRTTKRLKGVHQAASKLAKEDFEALAAYIAEEETIIDGILALDEISKATLGSYIKNASRSAVNKTADAGVKIGKELGATGHVRNATWSGKAEKRLRGIAKATDRLTKEQKEQIEAVLAELATETK